MEYWLSGSVTGVLPALQPAAHTFLQVRHDVKLSLEGLSIEQVWRRLGQSAPIGFHALHLAGATDRLLTYARGEMLDEAQLAAARAESTATGIDAGELMRRVEAAMDGALDLLRRIDADDLFAAREVGRKRLPSTTVGIIMHAAEHAYRHAGQIATLRRALGA